MPDEPTGTRRKFFDAVRAGDRTGATALLEADRSLIDAFDQQEFGSTPLNLAAGRGNLEMVDLLLTQGADVNRRSDWWAGGFAPIHSIFWTHQRTMGPALIERGAVVDAHAAAGLGMLDRLRELLEGQPDLVRERGGDGQYPLHFAATPEVAVLLLSRGAEIDARDLDHESTAAQWAAQSRPDVATYLLEQGAAADPFLLTAIGDTARLQQTLDEDPGVLSAIIDERRFPVAGSEAEHIYAYTLGWRATLLHVAARCNRPESIRVLVGRGLDAGIRGDHDACTPLHVAAWEGATDAIEGLLDAGAPIDVSSGEAHENEPLGWAIVSGKVEAVRTLLIRGAPIHEHHGVQARRGTDGDFLERSCEPIESWQQIVEMLDGGTKGHKQRM